MNEEELRLVESGLSGLLKRYKLNLREGDLNRMKATQDAKVAIRKVILSVSVKGSVKDIVPILEGRFGAGWEVTDHQNKKIRYYA